MIHFKLVRVFGCSFVAASFMHLVHADTFVIDDNGGPGVNFTDIPPAVTLAVPGDVLLVMPGSYSAFALSEGLTILGSQGASVASGSRILNLPAGQRASVADLQLRDLTIGLCDGTVLLDQVSLDGPSPSLKRLVIASSLDVRLYACNVPALAGRAAIDVSNSRVEIVGGTIRGGDGIPGSPGGDGGNAIEATTARIHLSLPNVHGGWGGDDNIGDCGSFIPAQGGDGGHGLTAWGSEILVSARVGTIAGGRAGWTNGLTCDGFPGLGGQVTNCLVRFTLGDFVSFFGSPSLSSNGGTLSTPTFEDPSMERLSAPSPGMPVTVRIVGAPGASARFLLGRFPTLIAGNPQVVEQLTTQDRIVDLGALPPSGERILNLQIPPSLPRGFVYYTQASVVNPDGSFQRTNSVPLLLR